MSKQGESPTRILFKRVTGSTTRNHVAEALMSEKAKECPKKLNNGRFR
jgi:hypothetical protein